MSQAISVKQPFGHHIPLKLRSPDDVRQMKKEIMNKSRLDTTPKSNPVIRPLRLLAVSERLQVSVRELAAAGGCGGSTMHGILTRGAWPSKLVVRRKAITELLRSKGATEEELDTLYDHIDPTPHRVKQARAKPIEQPQETDVLIGKQSLSMEARKAFQLFTNPFTGEVTTEAEMFQSGEIRFIREACWQCAINGAFVAVVGESGAGKTTIFADLKERIASSNKSVIVIEPSVLGMEENDNTGKTIKAADILVACIATLDPTAAIPATIERRARLLNKLLENSVTAGNHHVMVIEEAHSLPKPTLRHFKRLLEATRIGRMPGLGILLIAQPELLKKLNEHSHDLREVFQRIEILQLRPLDGDLVGYLKHRAKNANRELSDLITDKGIEAIRTRFTIDRRIQGTNNVINVSMLYPLAINNLMTAALNEAAALGAPVVDENIIRGL